MGPLLRIGYIRGIYGVPLTGPIRRDHATTLGVRVWGLGLGFRVSGLGFRVSGLGFRVSGLGFRV